MAIIDYALKILPPVSLDWREVNFMPGEVALQTDETNRRVYFMWQQSTVAGIRRWENLETRGVLAPHIVETT